MLVYQLLHIGRCTLHSSPPAEDVEIPVQPSELDEDAAVEVMTESSADLHLDANQQTRHLHIRTFRLYVLKVGATIVRHGRYLIFRIAQSAVAAWRQFWNHFQELHWSALPNI